MALLAGVLVIASDSIRAESLQDALRFAYARNPSLAAVRNDVEVVDEDIAAAAAAGRPQLNATTGSVSVSN